MPSALANPRFGPFEVDVRAGELRKHGIPIRLPDQSFRILSMLLETPGEIVLRNEIRLRLWPDDTVVDFDQSISSAVRRLRSALGDSADTPQYVETVAKRGYRFLGEVENGPQAAKQIPPTPSRFRLGEKLGEGFRGVVYQAEDLQLGRQVAVKLLRSAGGAIADPARVEREARTASSLSHPNICTIYGIEAFAEGPGIVMELLAGETLAARLARGPVTAAEALEIAIPVTAALEEAHRGGVVHGHLKPSNIMLTRNGVKVLGFGLGHAAAGIEAPGMLPYLSPEQRDGREPDALSDVFCLGLLLDQATGLPPALAAFVERCLSPDPGARWQSAGAAKEELERIARSARESATPGPKSRPPWRMPRLWFIAVALVLGACYFVWNQVNPFGASVEITGVSRLTGTGDIASVEISPDGRTVAYESGEGDHDTLWVKQSDADTGVQLVDFGSDTCGGMAFSADGQSLYFSRKPVHTANGTLYRIAVTGGYPELILSGISGQPFVSPDGRRVAFVRSTRPSGGEDALIVASAGGGSERELARYPPPGIHHNELAWTSDGRRIGYIAMGKLNSTDAETGRTRLAPDQNWVGLEGVATSPYRADELLITGIRPGGSTPPQIFRVSLDSDRTRQLTHEALYRRARATADGQRIVALKDDAPRSIHVVTLKGGAADRVAVRDAQMSPNSGITWTPEGRILFTSMAPREDRGDLWMVDADGSNLRRVRQSQGIASFSLPHMPPQGQIAAFVVWTQFEGAHIALLDIGSGQVRQLTSGTQDDEPAVSPDGKWVVYRGLEGRIPVLMRVPVEGGTAKPLTDYAAERPAVSPDGKWIACFAIPGKSGRAELTILPSGGGAPVKVFPLPSTVKVAVRPVWTPDGAAVAYVNRVNGASNIWSQGVAGGKAKAVTGFEGQDIYHFDWSRDDRLAVTMGVDNTDAMMLHVRR